MTTALSRRRFLSISAAVIAAGPAAAASEKSARWQGRAMGAPAQMVISGLDQAAAAPLFARVEAELLRLEKIFSLFHPGSQLTRLNTAGHLTAPAPELLDVLSLSASLNAATKGAFDPTVQPLWQALALGQDIPNPVVGWQFVSFDSTEVRLQRPEMALTLNGIAQGYITDRVAGLLRSAGLQDVLLDMGEIAALGQRPDGSAWQVGVATPDGELRSKLTLSDRALATSAAAGTLVGDAQSHILDPQTGKGAEPTRLVSVSAPRAALADGLSTALCLLPKAAGPKVIRQFEGAKLEYSA
ncbi:FAD:protein FMN transferase [Pseudophaeobacter sp.]|uniref:FAD:protein FMN transferase n=1 Tax=Pseudophaeobacter sp. TaxID=1971739 RepID=UPI00329864AC